jgi:hypothetical protein
MQAIGNRLMRALVRIRRGGCGSLPGDFLNRGSLLTAPAAASMRMDVWPSKCGGVALDAIYSG